MRPASPPLSLRSRPSFASRPPFVRGIPSSRDSFAFAADIPRRRLREKPPLFMPQYYTAQGEMDKGEREGEIKCKAGLRPGRGRPEREED